MKDRVKLLALTVLVVSVCGCSMGNGPGLFGGPGLFSNVNGARIAPPPTGSIQYPQQVASLPDPYYGQSATTGQPTSAGQPAATNPHGWRPVGTTNPAPGTPVTYNPTSYNIQNAPRNTIPAGNLTVASSTSTLQPTASRTTTAQVPVTPAANPVAAVPSNPVAGGMPLNDATRFASTTPASSSGTGISNRTWEYVARPSGPHQPGTQHAPQPVYVNGTVVAASSTYNGPQPAPYGYPNNQQNRWNGYPANYSGGYPAGNVAQGWRQRDVAR